MRPTKKELLELSDAIDTALRIIDTQVVSTPKENAAMISYALRIAANMPSEEEIVAEIYKACGEASTPGNSTYACLGHIAVYGVRRAFANAWTGGKEINLP